MSKIIIENYRGFDIEFDTNYEKFQCIVTEDNTKESMSYSAIKKFVDDYKKTNQDFKPFLIEYNPTHYKRDKLKVVGLRKDNRFIVEDEKGDRKQLSDYDTDSFILFKEENESSFKLLKELKEKREKQREENLQAEKDIIAKMAIQSVKDYKKELLS